MHIKYTLEILVLYITTESLSNAVFILCWKHVGGYSEGATSASAVGGHYHEVEEGEEHA